VRSIVIGTAGHIDHGKSALVRALTGTDPDRLKEEQERGITIDLGFAHLEESGVTFAFVDVPGHERFVKNMLAGAGGTDLVMLIVAADESVMPQTREHFHICRLLQVPAGVIVLTKTDLVDRETVDLVTLEVRELVQDSFMANAPIVTVSSRTGEGLDCLRATLRTLAFSVPARHADGPARMPIDRVFSMRGFGTIVTGTLVSGTVRDEQELVVLPRPRHVKVRGLQVHGRRDSAAEAGRRVALNLGGIEVSEITRGDTLCEPGAFEPTRRIDVALTLLPDVRPLRDGGRVRVHCGTSEILGRVAMAGRYARVRLESPAVVTRGDRFILRAYSPIVTIGGGIVLDPNPPRVAMRSEAGLRRFDLLDLERHGPETAVALFVEERGAAGLHRGDLMRRAGLSHAAAGAVADRLAATGVVTIVGDLLVSSRVLNDLENRLVTDLEAHHAAHPLSDGLPREEARERIFRRASQPVFEWVIEHLVAARRLVARERLALQSHQVSLTTEEALVQAALERVYREAKLTPPDLTTAAAATSATPAIVERVLALLLRNRTLVKVDTMVFHASALDELKTEVRALKQGSEAPKVDVAAFKARYGITRKYAIPLLEYLDRERVTRRVGEARIVL
jgi:selenocysteine-specific elongation factor